MILERCHTWMHLFPRDAVFTCADGSGGGAAGGTAPAWFREQVEAHGGGGSGGDRLPSLVAWNRAAHDLPDLDGYDGLAAVNCGGLTGARLRDAGFAYVRRFAVLPTLREARWFIPLDSPAVTAAALRVYTPFRLSAKLKLCAARAAIRARAPIWYRDELCVVRRRPPPLEDALRELLAGRDVRLALLAGASGLASRRKPAVAAIGAGGEMLAFAKLAGSPVARELLAHEAQVLGALAAMDGPGELAPRLLFASEIGGTYAIVQSPIEGRPVGPELTDAHHRFLAVLRHGPARPAAEAGIIRMVRRLASAGPSPRPDLLAALDAVMPVLARLNVPVTVTHTDFVPWNLRRRADGRLAAFDWDTAELDGLPLYDQIRHLTFVGHCIGRWTARRAHDRLVALAESAPLELRPPQVWALATVYLVHAILRFLMQGHGQEPVVVWHEELLARLTASGAGLRAGRVSAGAPAAAADAGAVLSTEVA